MDQTGQQAYSQPPLFELEELTMKNAQSLELLKEQLLTARQMVKDSYANNSEYVTSHNMVEGEKKQLDAIKHELDLTPEIAGLNAKIKDIQREMKIKKQDISEYALEYSQQSGTTQIDRNGVTYDIVKSATLVRHKS